jgi:hypothetical protein
LRRLLKFLHTLGAIGLMGAMASFLVACFAPAPTSLGGQAAVTGAMALIATWIFLPSLVVTLISGLLAMAASPGYLDAGWVWIKAATGILIFEGGFTAVAGPIQEAGRTSGAALAGHLAPGAMALSFGAERNTLWVLLAVALANVALGVWRPRMPQYPDWM